MSALWGRQGFKFYDRISGFRVLDCFERLNRSQWLNADEHKTLQFLKLQGLLQYANRFIPFYKRVFYELNFHPTDILRDPNRFQEIPVVSKSYIREHMDEFLTTEPNHRKFALQSSTSGSTGEPLVFWEDRQFCEYFIASTLLHHSWCGWKMGVPRLYLWGSLPCSKKTIKDRFHTYLKNVAWYRRFFTAYELSEKKMRQLVNWIRKNKPYLIQAYPASLYCLAQFIQDNGWRDIRLPAVYTSGEVLFPYQRKYYEDTFACSVFNKYATMEISEIACECEAHKGMHINTETCLVEILDGNGCPVTGGVSGYVTATCLTNYVFPFIRYRLEDFGRLHNTECPCGRKQPLFELLKGRAGDVFKTKSGQLIWGECLDMFAVKGVRQWQIIQKSLDLFIVRLVVDGTFNKKQLGGLEGKFKSLMGKDITLKFEFLDALPVIPGKKFRSAISEIDLAL